VASERARGAGQVVERQGRGGRTYAIRFRAYGERHFVTLGNQADGWTRARAELELQNVLADVRRGLWRPAARPKPAEPPPDPHKSDDGARNAAGVATPNTNENPT
jgi:integrase